MSDSESEKFNFEKCFSRYRNRRPKDQSRLAPPEDNCHLGTFNLSLHNECQEQRPQLPQWVQEQVKNNQYWEWRSSQKDTKHTKNKKPLAFKHLGFSTPEQDLESLQETSNHKVYRSSALENPIQKQAHEKFNRLLALLCEDHYRMNWKFEKDPMKQEIVCEKEDDSDMERLKQRQFMKSGVILELKKLKIDFETASESTLPKLREYLDTYLETNELLKQLYQETSFKYTHQHLQFDQLGKFFMTKTKSAKAALRFAALTGNVCYLLYALDFLQTEPDQSITGEEIIASALKSPNYQSPLVVTKYNNTPQDFKLPKNVCGFSQQGGKCFTWTEIEEPFTLFRRHTFNHEKKVWEEDSSWKWRCFRKFSKPFSFNSLNFGGQLQNIVVDSDGRVIQEYEQDRDTNLAKCFEIIQQTLGKNKGIARFFVLEGESEKDDQQKLCFTAAVDKGLKTYIFDHQLGITKSLIIEHPYDRDVINIKVIERSSHAIVVYKNKDGCESYEIVNLLQGKLSNYYYQSGLVTDKNLVFQEKTALKTNFEEFNLEKPPVPSCDFQFFDKNSVYRWPKKDQFELFKMKMDFKDSEKYSGSCVWNLNEEGKWTYNKNDKEFRIIRGQKHYTATFSNNNLDLDVRHEGSAIYVENYSSQSNHRYQPLKEQDCYDGAEIKAFDQNENYPVKELLQNNRSSYRVQNCKKENKEGQTWIMLDLKKHVTFSALALWTSDKKEFSFQPSVIQVFRAFQGKWIPVNEEKFDWEKTYRSHENNSQMCFVQCGLVRTNAILLNVKNAGGNEIWARFLQLFALTPEGHQEIKDIKMGRIESSIKTIESEGKFNCPSEFFKEKANQIEGNKSLFSYQTFELNTSTDQLEKTEISAFSKDFFDMSQKSEVCKKPQQTLSANICSILIATAIDCFSKYEKQSRQYEAPINWLHHYPTAEFFQLFVKILCRKDAQINQLLSKCFFDNLYLCLVFGIDISQLEDKLYTKQEFQEAQDALCNADSNGIYNFLRFDDKFKNQSYRKQIEKELEEQKPMFKDNQPVMSKHVLRFHIRSTCAKIMNGDFHLFQSTYSNLLENKRYEELEAIVISLTQVKELLPPIVQNLLLKTINDKSQGIPSHLLHLIDYIFQNKIVKQYLRFKDTNKRDEFDMKGYLVTQSELLSGGIQGNQIEFFKESTKSDIQACCDLIQDQTLAYKAEDQAKAPSSDNIFLQILHSKTNEFVDKFINILNKQTVSTNIQAKLLSKKNNLGYNLTRAAFAVIVKMNPQIQGAIEEIVDQIDLKCGEDCSDIPEEKGSYKETNDRDQELLEICQENSQYENIRKLWVQAAKMYSWLHQKLASIARKYDDITNEDERERKEKDHLDQVYKAIILKAEFLIKLNPPKEFAAIEQKQISFQRMPSYVNSSMPREFLKQTSSYQAKQAVKINVEQQIAATQSILSCLQTPVLCSEIQTQVEQNYLSAVRRYTGLVMLNQTISQDSSSSEYIDAVKCIREIQIDQNGVKHYLDEIQGGCNQHVDTSIRKVMFEILIKFAKRLEVTKNQDEAYQLIYALHWQYHAQDFKQLLENISIFPLIAGKDRPDSVMAQTWGKISTQYGKLRDDLTLSFTEILLTVMARISDVKLDTQTQLKVHGDQALKSTVPSLRKVKSLLDVDSSSQLIDEAMRIVFRSFDTICKQTKAIEKLSNLDTLTLFDESDAEKRIQILQQIVDGVKKFKFADHEKDDDGQRSKEQHVSESLLEKQKSLIKLCPKNKKDMLQAIPNTWYKDIILPNKVRVKTHPHTLYKKNDKCYPVRNACDARKSNDFCLNNLDHYSPKYNLIWRCDICDFDYCEDCAQLEVFVDEFLTQNFDWGEWMKLPKNVQRKVMPEAMIKNFPYLNHVMVSGGSRLPYLRCDEYTDSYRGYNCNTDGDKENCRWSRNKSLSCRDYMCFRDQHQNDCCLGCASVDWAQENFFNTAFKQDGVFDFKVYFALDPSLQQKILSFDDVIEKSGCKKGPQILNQHKCGKFTISESKECSKLSCVSDKHKIEISCTVKCDKCDLAFCVRCFLRLQHNVDSYQSHEQQLQEILSHEETEEIFKNLPRKVIKNVELSEKEILKVHEYCVMKKERNVFRAESCQFNKKYSLCYSLVNNDSAEEVFICRECDVIVCLDCARADKFINQHNESNWDWIKMLKLDNHILAQKMTPTIMGQVKNEFKESYPPNIKLPWHNCELKLRRTGGGYGCDGGRRHLQGGCATKIRLRFFETPSYRCDRCDWDSCINCVKVELAHQYYADLLVKEQNLPKIMESLSKRVDYLQLCKNMKITTGMVKLDQHEHAFEFFGSKKCSNLECVSVKNEIEIKGNFKCIENCGQELCILCFLSYYKTDKVFEDFEVQIVKLVDWENPMKNIMKALPKSLYENIDLDQRVKFPSHECILTKRHRVEGRSWRWACDSSRYNKYCINGLSDFESHHSDGWRCDDCDFDLCIDCAKAELYVNKMRCEKLWSWSRWWNLTRSKTNAVSKEFLQKFQEYPPTAIKIPGNELGSESEITLRPTQQERYTCNAPQHIRQHDEGCRFNNQYVPGFKSDDSNLNFHRCLLCIRFEILRQGYVKHLKESEKIDWEEFVSIYKQNHQNIHLSGEELVKLAGFGEKQTYEGHEYTLKKVDQDAGFECSNCSNPYKNLEKGTKYFFETDNTQFCLICTISKLRVPKEPKIEEVMKEESTDQQVPITLEQIALEEGSQTSDEEDANAVVDEIPANKLEFARSVQKQMRQLQNENVQFNLGLLLQSVKMLSSVALVNEPCRRIVSQIANPYYVRTLLQLLMQVPMKQKNMILNIVRDLVGLQLNLSLDEQPLLPIKMKMGSWLNDFLYAYAYQCAKDNEYQIVKILVNTLMEIGGYQQIVQDQMKELATLDELDQILLLWLTDSGAQLMKMSIGDKIRKVRPDLAVEEQLTVINVKGNDVKCFNPSRQKKLALNRHEVEFCNFKPQNESLELDVQQVQTILADQDAKIEIKIMIVNALIRSKNRDKVKDLAPVLWSILKDISMKNTRKQLNFYLAQFSQLENACQTMEQNEELCVECIFKKKTPKTEKAPLTLSKRSLVKQLYKKPQLELKTNKELNENDLIQWLMHLYCLSEAEVIYHLTTDPSLKSSLSPEFNMKLNMNGNILKGLSIDQIHQRLQQNAYLKPSFFDQVSKRDTFKRMMRAERRYEDLHLDEERQSDKIKLQYCNSKILLAEKVGKLLFDSVDQINDAQELWLLHWYFMISKQYSYYTKTKQSGLSPRFVNLLCHLPAELKSVYINRSLQSNKEGFKASVMLNIAAKCYLNKPNSWETGIDLINKMLIFVNQDFDDNFTKQHQARQLMERIREILLYFAQNSQEGIQAACKLSWLRQLLHQASCLRNHKMLYQYKYAAILIQQAIPKNEETKKTLWKYDFEQIAFPPNFIENLVKGEESHQTLQKYKISTAVKKNNTVEKFIEVSGDRLNDWIEIPAEEHKDESTEIKRLFQFRLTEGSGPTFVEISDQPQITSKTKQLMLSGNQTKEAQMNLKNKKFIRFCGEPHLLLFSGDNCKPYQLPNVKLENHSFDFLGLPISHTMMYFLMNKGGEEVYFILNLIEERKQIQVQFTGFKGQIVKAEKNWNDDDGLGFFLINQNNNIFQASAEDISETLNKAMEQQRSGENQQTGFSDENGEWVNFKIISLEQIEGTQIYSGAGITERNTNLDIFVENVIDDVITVKFTEVGKKEVQYQGSFKNNKKLLVSDESKKFLISRLTNEIQCKNLMKNHLEKNPDFKFDHVQLRRPRQIDWLGFVKNQVYKCNFDGSEQEVQELMKLDSYPDGKKVTFSHYYANEKLIVGFDNGEFRAYDNQGKQITSESVQKITKVLPRRDIIFVIDDQKKGGYLRPNLEIVYFGEQEFKNNNVVEIYQILDEDDGGICCYFKTENPDQQFIVSRDQDHVNTRMADRLRELFERQKGKGDWVQVDFQGNALYVVDKNNRNFKKAEYGMVKNEEEKKSSWKYSDEQIKLCVEYIDHELAQIKRKKLYHMIHRRKSIHRCIKLQDFGHNQELIEMILGINQFVYDRKLWVQAMAYDQEYTSMQGYIQMAEKFMCKSILMLIVYDSQIKFKLIPNCHRHQRIKFWRISSTETLFDQLIRQTEDPIRLYRVYNGDERPFKARFKGEDSYDAGGPFRDVLEQICDEVQKYYFKPACGDGSPDFVAYQPQIKKDVQSLTKYKYLGNLIGWAIHSYDYNLSMDLNNIFWSNLLDKPITKEDIRINDKFRIEMLEAIEQGIYPSNFVAAIGDDEIELCENGAEIEVNQQNVQRFVSLWLEKYIAHDKLIYDTIKQGVLEIVNPRILRSISPKIGSMTAFSDGVINPNVFIDLVRPRNSNDKTMVKFYQMVRNFNNHERAALLKFITGSSRLSQTNRIRISVYDGRSDGQFPIGHTCGYSCDVPAYSSQAEMDRHFRIAIEMCGEIDDDGNYVSDYGDSSSGRGHSSDYGEEVAVSLSESSHQSSDSRSSRDRSEESDETILIIDETQNQVNYYRPQQVQRRNTTTVLSNPDADSERYSFDREGGFYRDAGSYYSEDDISSMRSENDQPAVADLVVMF